MSEPSAFNLFAILIYFENDAITHFVGILILDKNRPCTPNLTGKERHISIFVSFAFSYIEKEYGHAEYRQTIDDEYKSKKEE